MEKKCPLIFAKTMTNFKRAKAFRETLGLEGKPIKIPWQKALETFYYAKGNRFVGVKEEDRDIAELFEENNLSKEDFDKVSTLREQAKDKSVPEHILGVPLREETILESIEKIKAQTEIELQQSKQMVEKAYEKEFTYEWLSKYDAHNGIIGLFTSCCATLAKNKEDVYGMEIARASITANDVQNLVVRNSGGEIVAKGTIYVNKKDGYGVINDFEINEKYRKSEEKNEKGRYRVPPTSNQEQEREKIFQAFQRGLKAFIAEYDRQNPTNPLKQVNVGMGYNRLKRQVERLKKATNNLSVPLEYEFKDAENEQYILYTREEKVDRGVER